MTIRMVNRDDIEDIKQVLDSIELFPSDMLEDMMADYLENRQSQEVWFTAVQEEKPIAIGYCAPEQLTVGTYNLYAIGVRNDIQGKGTGSKMMQFIEDHLRSIGGRLLIVDTSGTPDFSQTRAFYENLGYRKEAVIRDFWNEGDDKVTYWKKLNG